MDFGISDIIRSQIVQLEVALADLRDDQEAIGDVDLARMDLTVSCLDSRTAELIGDLRRLAERWEDLLVAQGCVLLAPPQGGTRN